MDPKCTLGYGVSKIGNQNRFLVNLAGSNKIFLSMWSNLYISGPQIVFTVDTHVKQYLDC